HRRQIMSRSTRYFSYLTVAVLSLALGVAIAAPILPGRAVPEPDVMSVANITRVRLFVHPINDARMEGIGFTTEAVEKQMRDRLRTTGIEVVDDGDAPLLSMRTLWIHEPKVNEARGYLLLLRLEQPAQLPRLDRT